MEVNIKVIEEVKQLGFLDKAFFGLLSLKRIVTLYKLYDDLVFKEKLEPINNNYAFIVNVINYLLESTINNTKPSDVKLIEFENELATLPFEDLYGSPDEFVLAANILGGLENLLHFYIKKKDQCIEAICDIMIETINILVRTNIYQSKSTQNDEEISLIVEQYYESELLFERTLVRTLQEIMGREKALALIDDYMLTPSLGRNDNFK